MLTPTNSEAVAFKLSTDPALTLDQTKKPWVMDDRSDGSAWHRARGAVDSFN